VDQSFISLKKIGVHFQDWSLHPIDLSVEKESIAVILGPSGSGKTTILKLIAGLIQPTEGELVVRSKNIGMLFQKNALFDSLTVLENLTFPMKERLGLTGKPAQEQAIELLKAVGLDHVQNLYPDEISGGMQKRLGIARALAVQPEVILYDDPTAGLDPITSRTIAELILKIKKERKSTLVVVTNDIHRAYQLGDQIYLLSKGKLISTGSPNETKNSKDPLVRQFIEGLTQGPLTEHEESEFK
jgi:phospholipid/cholesterol/gamma-HCH transport system ATP-binding protein